jgi:hypothetical protein
VDAGGESPENAAGGMEEARESRGKGRIAMPGGSSCDATGAGERRRGRGHIGNQYLRANYGQFMPHDLDLTENS